MYISLYIYVSLYIYRYLFIYQSVSKCLYLCNTLSLISGVVLADGFVASPISTTFGATQPVATMVQAHTQGAGVGGAPTLVSSPRPSILRKKPATEG